MTDPRTTPTSSQESNPHRLPVTVLSGLLDSLQACLLTDEELALGIEAWQSYPDPFPPWNVSAADFLSSADSE
ncbi:hypothetical protein [Bremerella cremea]|uniref:hypothetical protein n=1 Tax=Bremerella cremea TaxID=1031537 RepID=UPI0018F2FFB7|nr:hypothetical protein [Bremerella cremea]